MLGLARGKELDGLGALFGVRRRWHGIEPDFMYRRRVRKAMLEDVS